MRVKKVNRYYCEFCKKSGCAAGHMKKHEERCTMNPDRVCGMCKMMDWEQPSIADLIALLPTPEECSTEDKYGYRYFSGDKIDIEPLRRITNCPACLLSAIRQSGIPVPAVQGFDYKKECDGIWSELNADHPPEY